MLHSDTPQSNEQQPQQERQDGRPSPIVTPIVTPELSSQRAAQGQGLQQQQTHRCSSAIDFSDETKPPMESPDAAVNWQCRRKLRRWFLESESTSNGQAQKSAAQRRRNQKQAIMDLTASDDEEEEIFIREVEPLNKPKPRSSNQGYSSVPSTSRENQNPLVMEQDRSSDVSMNVQLQIEENPGNTPTRADEFVMPKEEDERITFDLLGPNLCRMASIPRQEHQGTSEELHIPKDDDDELTSQADPDVCRMAVSPSPIEAPEDEDTPLEETLFDKMETDPEDGASLAKRPQPTPQEDGPCLKKLKRVDSTDPSSGSPDLENAEETPAIPTHQQSQEANKTIFAVLHELFQEDGLQDVQSSSGNLQTEENAEVDENNVSLALQIGALLRRTSATPSLSGTATSTSSVSPACSLEARGVAVGAEEVPFAAADGASTSSNGASTSSDGASTSSEPQISPAFRFLLQLVKEVSKEETEAQQAAKAQEMIRENIHLITQLETPKQARFCARCAVHGERNLLKGHKGKCQFEKCTCAGCQKIEMAKEKRLKKYTERNGDNVEK